MAPGLLAAAAGLLIGVGVWLLLVVVLDPPPSGPATSATGGQVFARRPHRRRPRVSAVQLAAAAAAAAVVLLWTGWPVGAVLAAVGAIGLPAVWRSGQASAAEIDRLEAIADWTRRLSTLIAAGQGLEEALVSSARTVPERIRAEVTTLARRVQANVRTETALRAFAADVADVTADEVVAALILASRRQGRGLVQILTHLADSTQRSVQSRREVDAHRAGPRQASRMLILISAGLLVLWTVLFPAWMSVYDSGLGQLVLAVAGMIYVIGCWALARAARLPTPGRIFLSDPLSGAAAPR